MDSYAKLNAYQNNHSIHAAETNLLYSHSAHHQQNHHHHQQHPLMPSTINQDEYSSSPVLSVQQQQAANFFNNTNSASNSCNASQPQFHNSNATIQFNSESTNSSTTTSNSAQSAMASSAPANSANFYMSSQMRHTTSPPSTTLTTTAAAAAATTTTTASTSSNNSNHFYSQNNNNNNFQFNEQFYANNVNYHVYHDYSGSNKENTDKTEQQPDMEVLNLKQQQSPPNELNSKYNKKIKSMAKKGTSAGAAVAMRKPESSNGSVASDSSSSKGSRAGRHRRGDLVKSGVCAEAEALIAHKKVLDENSDEDQGDEDELENDDDDNDDDDDDASIENSEDEEDEGQHMTKLAKIEMTDASYESSYYSGSNHTGMLNMQFSNAIHAYTPQAPPQQQHQTAGFKNSEKPILLRMKDSSVVQFSFTQLKCIIEALLQLNNLRKVRQLLTLLNIDLQKVNYGR